MILRRLTHNEVDRCAHVAAQAFGGDRHTQLKSRMICEPYDHEVAMRAALTHWLQRPQEKVALTVAVDERTGDVTGWVAWGFQGFDSARIGEQSKDQVARRSDKTNVSLSKLQTARSKLESHTRTDLEFWMQQLMPSGSKCMYVLAIAVRPDRQGQGVGSELLRTGTRRADVENVTIWVHASEGGAGLFQSHGFHEVGNLKLNLDAWNEEGVHPPEGPEAKWGSYTSRYMKRYPIPSGLTPSEG